MQHKHWNQEELLAILYGVNDAGADACGECTAKLAALRERRASDAASAVDAIADRQLAAQRASIYARLESRPANRWMWMAAPLAAAAALLVAVNLQTAPQVGPVAVAQNTAAVVETADETLYSDIYQTVTQETPGGVSVVSAMFETAKN